MILFSKSQEEDLSKSGSIPQKVECANDDRREKGFRSAYDAVMSGSWLESRLLPSLLFDLRPWGIKALRRAAKAPLYLRLFKG
jgi:hypothetical protein